RPAPGRAEGKARPPRPQPHDPHRGPHDAGGSQTNAQMTLRIAEKSEARRPVPPWRDPIFKCLKQERLDHLDFDIWICFGFRYSDLEFPRAAGPYGLSKTARSKSSHSMRTSSPPEVWTKMPSL